MKQKVVCIDCKIIRIDEIDLKESEKECHIRAKNLCRVCGCPYVQTEEESLK